jgi:hypothetical protein
LEEPEFSAAQKEYAMHSGQKWPFVFIFFGFSIMILTHWSNSIWTELYQCAVQSLEVMPKRHKIIKRGEIRDASRITGHTKLNHFIMNPVHCQLGCSILIVVGVEYLMLNSKVKTAISSS